MPVATRIEPGRRELACDRGETGGCDLVAARVDGQHPRPSDQAGALESGETLSRRVRVDSEQQCHLLGENQVMGGGECEYATVRIAHRTKRYRPPRDLGHVDACECGR